MGVRSMNNIETRANSAAGKGGRQFPAWLVMVLLVLVTMGLYWPAMSCGFVNYDDPLYVTENWHVQGGLTWSGVKWAFYNTGQAAYWAPLMWLSHELACQLFGLQPWGHHLINLLLHAANTVLVYLLFRRLTGAFWQSAIVAALFGWHPLRVESVVWVTERKDVLSICFGLLTLITYARYVEKSKVQSSKSKVWYGLALLLFALGLMSKAMLVTWPMVMVLLDWWPLKRFKVQGSGFKVRSLVWEKVPFFGLAVAASVVTFMAQRHGGAMHVVASLPLGARGGNASDIILPIFGEAVLASGPVGILSASRVLADGRGVAGGGVAPGHDGAMYHGAAALSVYADGLVVVCGDIGAGDWVSAGGRSGDGGPFYLHSITWGAGHGGVGGMRTGPAMAVSGNDMVGDGMWGNHAVSWDDAATAWVLEGR